VEGAIPAKGKAYGESGGIGQGDTRGRTNNAGGLRGLSELSPRFRDSGQPQQDLSAPLGGQSFLSKPSVRSKADAPAPKLSPSTRTIAAMLSDDHAAEDAEAAAGKRLAARFVRCAGEKASDCPKSSLTPYYAAGAFFLVAAGAAAYFFLAPGADQIGGSPYVAASFSSPFSSGAAQPAPSWAPKPDAQGPGSPGWAETVETFRALSGSGAPAPADKVSEPELEKLAAGYQGAR
jgi:hypothetical protein